MPGATLYCSTRCTQISHTTKLKITQDGVLAMCSSLRAHVSRCVCASLQSTCGGRQGRQSPNDNTIIALAFDIGLKRTGVAVGQSINKTARPVTQLLVSNGRHDWAAIDTLIQQWQPNLIVIGKANSSDPHLNKAINRFKSHIQQNHKLPIFEMDERLTSVAANAEIADHGFSTERKVLLRDQVAACLILESYFNSL